MDVLVPDRSTATGRALAADLEQGGHSVHSCAADDGALPCASLAGHACPLDTTGIDVVVDVHDPSGRRSTFGDGALCGLRRRIPLVVAGDSQRHPLLPFAVAEAGSDVRAAVAAVAGRPLPGQTAAAARALLHELRNHGTDSDSASVEVFRRPGRLLVELCTDGSMSRTQAEQLATHVAQAVRGYDRWAPKLDVSVRHAATDRTPAAVAG